MVAGMDVREAPLPFPPPPPLFWADAGTASKANESTSRAGRREIRIGTPRAGHANFNSPWLGDLWIFDYFSNVSASHTSSHLVQFARHCDHHCPLSCPDVA